MSESSPTAREDAIAQMMQKRPERRDRVFYSAKDVVDITGLPGYWIHHNQERLRLGIPFYRIANGDVIRFSIEEMLPLGDASPAPMPVPGSCHPSLQGLNVVLPNRFF